MQNYEAYGLLKSCLRRAEKQKPNPLRVSRSIKATMELLTFKFNQMESNKIKAYTIKATCDMLNCSRTVYYYKHRANLVQILHTGSRILYSEKDVLAYIERLNNPDIQIIK